MNQAPAKEPSRVRRKRPALWLLAVPAVLYLLTPWVANTIQPVVLGMPFIVFYTVVVTVLTWAFIWLAARLDPLYRTGADEPVPADTAYGDDESQQRGATHSPQGGADHEGSGTP